MSSYDPNGSIDPNWPTPPDSTFFDSNQQSSYDAELLDVFSNDPYQSFNNSLTEDPRMYGHTGGMSMGGSSRVASGAGSQVAFSDDGSSPQGSAGNMSYASSNGYSTANTSHGGGATGGLDFDLDHLFNASNHPSPPFDFGNSMSCDFDTSNLQSLFTQPQTMQPYPQQTVSPDSTTGTSPYSIPVSMPSSQDFTFASITQPLPYPHQYLAPQAPQASYPSTTRHHSVSSASSQTYDPSPFLPDVDPASSAASKRRRLTLAETAGLVPQSLPQPQSISSSAAPKSFSVKRDSITQISASNSQPPPKTVIKPAANRRPSAASAKSPVEIIANAGLPNNGVHKAPMYQLLPKPVNIATAHVPVGGKGKRANPALATDGATGSDVQDGGAGSKRKKPSERGHNAVEQKYRNSINNALATLRDTIPALRHLKPLPSMPVSKRKASQFTLPSGIAAGAPQGLVDGVTAAKTLSKGVILNKAIEYIDFLRFSRESHNEDLDMLKEMVKTMVGGGEQLVAEFERKRGEREKERFEDREREREEGGEDGDEGGEGEEEEEEEEEKPAATKGKKATAASKKKAATKKETNNASKTKSMAASAAPSSSISLPSQHISPPLTSDYRHVQALNAAHLENIAAQHQQQQPTFPPSPVSSDEQSVSPAAVMGDPTLFQAYPRQPPRVLLASFMGLSFAGGIGYDWTSTATTAAEEAAEAAGSAWTSRLVRRSSQGIVEGGLVDLLHPSILSGLVALGLSSIVIALLFIVYPLLSTASSRSSSPPIDRRRQEALSSLANNSTSSATQSFEDARTSTLEARRNLRTLAGAPSPLLILPALAKEVVRWAIHSKLGLSWSHEVGTEHAEDNVERALAWIRIAEIEVSFGDEISYLIRLYTFFHLSNLSRSASWPQLSPSTSSPAVTALLSTHLLSTGHPRWAEALWDRVLLQLKKADETLTSADSFIGLALSSDFETVKYLLDPSTKLHKEYDDIATPSDSVPLLVVAEASCLAALEGLWTRLFTLTIDSTCLSRKSSTSSLPEDLKALVTSLDMDDTLEVVYKGSVEGSEVRTLALVTKAFLSALADPEDTNARAITKTCVASLVNDARAGGPFSRLAVAGPFSRLLLPSLSLDFDFAPIDESINEVDQLATTTLSWLLLRRESGSLLFDASAYPSPPPSPIASPEGTAAKKVNPVVHDQALTVRRLLAHDVFRTDGQASKADGELSNESIDFDEARDLLIDDLTTLARRAAGLESLRDDDSGIEL